jgi:hypothetical protein
MMSEKTSEQDRSEQDRSEQDRMDRLMELQSRLRELTEARKNEWRRAGGPLPDSNGVPPEPAVAEASAQPVAEATASPVEAAEVAVQTAEVAIQAAESSGARVFVRRRGLQARALTEALQQGAGKAAAVVREFGELLGRQVDGRIRDLSGGIGARKQPPRPRPGDPVTAEELIHDRSLSARLVGAAVLMVGILVIGGVVLVQLGKLELPWLEDSALPAATSRTPPPPGSGVAVAGSTEGRSGADVEGRVEGESQTDASRGDAAQSPAVSRTDEPGSDPASPGDAEQADVSGAGGAELLEFTRLQGDLAFLLGEYEIVRTEFEQGAADCGTLSERYARVDSSHLVLSRVVARSRELPRRQEQVYEELSALLDAVLRHYAASGCGLDPSELPD